MMSIEQALNNLDQAVAQINASREVHKVLSESLKTLADALKPKEKDA